MTTNNNIDQARFERIDKYVLGQLLPKEKMAFEKELLENPKLLNRLNEHKLLVEVIEKQSLKAKIEQYHSSLASSTDKRRSFLFKRPYSIAAAIALVIGLAVLWHAYPSREDRLYAKYYTPDPGLATVMGSEDQYEFYDAMVSYKHGDYDLAIDKWTKQEEIGSSDSIRFFLGSALMANDDFQEAMPYFKSVAEDSTSIFRDEAHYYLALAYLKLNKVDLAVHILSQSKSEKCQELLLELNN